MVKQRDISATRLHNGAWELALIIWGYRQSKVFYGYTKREAIRMYVAEINHTSAN